MDLSLPHIIQWLIQYQYIILLPICVIEGPIIIIIAAFLVSLGHMNGFAVLGIGILGDLIGDTFYYAVGRFGRDRFIKKYGKYIGVNEKRLLRFDKHFKKHAIKMLVSGKIAFAIGTLSLVAAGMTKMSFKKYTIINMFCTVPKMLLFFVIGYFFGKAYEQINHYIDLAGYGFIIAGVAIVLIYFLYKKIMGYIAKSVKV